MNQPPNKLKEKNMTKWIRGDNDLPVEYDALVDMGVIHRDGLLYFLDCEACFEALAKILNTQDKRVGNMSATVLNQIRKARQVTYVLAESLLQTVGTATPDKGRDRRLQAFLIAQAKPEGDVDSSDEDQGGPEDLPWECNTCKGCYWGPVTASCPRCHPRR